MNSRSAPEPAVPVGYGDLFEQVKSEVQAARVRAARVVNVEVIDLYWRIGRLNPGAPELRGLGQPGR